MDGHVGRDLNQRLRVVEDDLDAGADEVVGYALCRLRWHGEDADHGFRVVAIFDNDETKVGEEVGHLQVRSYSDLQKVVADEDIVVGVLAVPTEAAQGVADDLVRAGVKIIFNYSEALVQVPPDVTVHTSSPAVDLLYALYFYLT